MYGATTPVAARRACATSPDLKLRSPCVGDRARELRRACATAPDLELRTLQQIDIFGKDKNIAQRNCSTPLQKNKKLLNNK